MANPISLAGNKAIRFVQELGGMAIFAGDIARAMLTLPLRFAAFVREVYKLGVLSLLIICVCGLAVGMVLGGWISDRLQRAYGYRMGRVLVPVFGMLAFYDHYWSEKWSTSLGYSMLKKDNSPLELPSDFRRGQYALINLLSYPAKNVMIGGEFQWGKRNNFTDGFEVSDRRIQFGFRYNFDFKFDVAK